MLQLSQAAAFILRTETKLVWVLLVVLVVTTSLQHVCFN